MHAAQDQGRLTFHGRTARRDGLVVATVVFGGYRNSLAKVLLPDGSVIGRLMKAAPDLYEPWTALNPYAATPTDSRLAPAAPIADAIEVILGRPARLERAS